MDSIQFGVICPEEIRASDLGTYAQDVEGLGFDSIWATENLNSNVPSLECFSSLAFMAARTTRIILGTAVVVLPLRDPLLVGRIVSTLDALSGGRTILGVGVGGAGESTYRAYGGSVGERGARCDEQLEILNRLWTELSVTFEGKYYRLDDYTLLPRPVQEPHPPIWVGGRAEAVLRRAGRWADGFIPVSVSPETAAPYFDKVEAYAQGYGRAPSSVTRALHLYTCLADTATEAARVCSTVLSERYGKPVTRVPDRTALLGTPQECRAILQEFIQIGVTHFVIDPACERDQFMSQLEILAREIIPGLNGP